MAATKHLPPIHPGELLRDEIEERGVSLSEFSRNLRVPVSKISSIVNGKRPITADLALRLSRYFGTSAKMWMNLQAAYDLEVATRSVGDTIEREVLPAASLATGETCGPPTLVPVPK